MVKQNKNHLDIDYSVNVKHWNSFLPPLNKFNINKLVYLQTLIQ